MDKEELLNNIQKLHTTSMGLDRIKKNLNLVECDVLLYCKNKILDNKCLVCKRGKNYYCMIDGIEIAVNSYNYCIITAHLISK